MGSDSHATTSALADLRIFTPTAGFHTGLDLLAAAVSSSSGDRPMARPTSGELGLTKPGPFNPAASKVAKKILDLDFVEMSEVTMDTSPEPAMGRPGHPSVTSISQWMEKFAAMAALLSTRFPLKAPELFA